MATNHDYFLELLLRHQADIKAFIGSIIRDRHSREDVFQEVALILWRRFEEFDTNKSFGAWARGIAANKVLHEIRQGKRIPTTLETQSIEAILLAFERIAFQSTDRKDALVECLERLPERWKKLLAMKYEHDMRADEIGSQLQQRTDAIYQSLSRIRSKLADCVQSRLQLVEGGR